MEMRFALQGERRLAESLVVACPYRRAYEEKSLKEKVSELILGHEGLTEKEAEMVLRVCNNNEFEAADRINDEEEGEAFLESVR